jgi:hypothetical protein
MLLFLLLLYGWFGSRGLEFSRRSAWGFCCFKEEQIRRKKFLMGKNKLKDKKEETQPVRTVFLHHHEWCSESLFNN